VTINVYSERGIPLEKQWRSFQEIVGKPYDKDSVDAFTRSRIIWMYGTETEQWYFYHNMARLTENEEIKKVITQIRRTEEQQRNHLTHYFDPNASTLETTLGYEQLAVDLTAGIAKDEPDPYVKQTLDYILLEDFDHLFRYSSLMSRLEPNNDPHRVVRQKTQIKPGRPTFDEHRHPLDTLGQHVNAKGAGQRSVVGDVVERVTAGKADPLTLVHILSIVAPEQQTRQYYMSHGYEFKDELARQLYAEIGEIEEQHVTHYESLLDPRLTLLEMACMHEYNEVYDYYSCLQMETEPRFKALWEQGLRQELEHVRLMGDLLKKFENKELQQMLPAQLPKPIVIAESKDYVNQVLQTQLNLRPYNMQFVSKDKLPQDWPSHEYARLVNAANAPSTHFTQLGGSSMQAGQQGPRT
jgi:rubrerythrin